MHLGRRVSTINGVLPSLPDDPQVKHLLQDLRGTLREAEELVVAWQKRSSTTRFFRARRHADKFREVNARIDSHLSLFSLVGYAAIAGRLDRLFPPGHTGVPPPTTSAMSSSSLGSGSSSQQTPRVVSEYPRMFKWAVIVSATDNFAVELGRGSSDTVYKGRLHDGPEVAVKVLNRNGQQCMENPFVAELEILFPLRHDHIVRLVGWCAEEEDRMFIYKREHMINGTLRDHLQRTRGGSSSSPVTASWRIRVEVLLGVSRAIEHMHGRAARRIIHRNVSSSNILLDASWTPRLSGFGAAILQAAAGGQVVAEVVGTPGYVDPEYGSTKRVSPASDVYSFGVLILEALTGEDPATLVDSALPAIRNEKLPDVLDSRPATPSAAQLEALELVACTAETCLWPQGKARPPISNVVANLERALGIMTEE